MGPVSQVVSRLIELFPPETVALLTHPTPTLTQFRESRARLPLPLTHFPFHHLDSKGILSGIKVD